MRSLVFSCLLAVLAVCSLSIPSWALMFPLSTSSLTTHSESVVTGEVLDVKSSWDNSGRTIVTRSTVRVTELVRGVPTTSMVVVEQPGGTVGNITFKVSDMLSIEKGKNVLLFLKNTASRLGGTAYEVVGHSQGMYTVGSDGIAHKSGVTVAGSSQAGAQGPSGAKMAEGVAPVIDNDIPVKDLIEKIKAVK